MPISPVNSTSLTFGAKKAPKKKVKVKNAVKAALALTAATAAVSYATQKGKGGYVDMIISELQPLKRSALRFLSSIFHRISH